jgi:guanosine-3',5'-bis(diphosphate) 3'-pyrophosphohydrolase
MVRTGRARSKIRHYLKNMEQEESRAWARRCWPRPCAPKACNCPAADPGDSTAAALWQQLTRWSGNRNRGELLVDIGLGARSPSSWPSAWRS